MAVQIASAPREEVPRFNASSVGKFLELVRGEADVTQVSLPCEQSRAL